MKCIVCDGPITYFHTDPQETLHPCVSGTTFESTGNYGSTLWDMEGRKFLQLVICNPCLEKKTENVDVVVWGQPHIPNKELVSRKSFNQHREEEKAYYEKVNKPYHEAVETFLKELENQGFEEFIENRSEVLQAAFPAPIQGTYLFSSPGFIDLKTFDVGTHIKASITEEYVRLSFSVQAGTISRKLLFKDDWRKALADFIQEAEKPFG